MQHRLAYVKILLSSSDRTWQTGSTLRAKVPAITLKRDLLDLQATVIVAGTRILITH